MKSILDKRAFHDGRIVLYKRPSLNNPAWQMRIRVPGAIGYLIKSAGTTDVDEATRLALNLYDETRLRVMGGGALRQPLVTKLVTDYCKTVLKDDRKSSDYLYFHSYVIPHFEGKSTAAVTLAGLQAFLEWRRENPRRVKTPSENTIRAEIGYLRRFMRWAVARRYMDRVIEIERPSWTKNRRPHFDDKDWSRLTRHLREWQKVENWAHKRDRIMLSNYVLILANTGIRVGEARTLRWRDIRRHQSETNAEKRPDIVLWVTGKTGQREVVARTAEVARYFARIWEMRKAELGDEEPALDSFVFCHPDGKPIISFKKGFDSLIRAAKVEYSSAGERRTLYSLRHTYATFRLQEGVHQFHLARNMGTSTAMLEKFYGHTSNVAAADELTKSTLRRRSGKTLPWM
jgi:integrase